MRTISQDTITRLRELLNLLSKRPVTIDEIVLKTSIPNSTTAHKLLAKLSNEHGFTVIVTKVKKRTTRCGTKIGMYYLCATQHAKAAKTTDDELGKRCGTVSLSKKIKEMMANDYSIDYICAKLDRTRSCILYHANKNGIDTTVRRDKSTPARPVVTDNDLLTIYSPRPKSLT